MLSTSEEDEELEEDEEETESLLLLEEVEEVETERALGPAWRWVDRPRGAPSPSSWP